MGTQSREGCQHTSWTCSPPDLALTMALELSAIIGIVLMAVGSALAGWGLVLCYTTKGEYYNSDEVQAMVAAEMLEEKRKKMEEEEMFDDIGAEAGQAGGGKKKRRGPMIAE